MNSDSQPVSDHQLLVLLFQTRDLMLSLQRRELKKYGSTVEEATMLIHISKLGDKATPTELSRQLLRRHHSITGILLRMEKKGLIKRNKDLRRKNMIRVSITEKGETVYQNARREDVLDKLADMLSDKQKQDMAKYLNILREGAFDLLGIEDKPEIPF